MFDIEKIHPQIFVFKNALSNSKDIVDHYSSPFYSWEPWYTFGSQLNLSNDTINFYNLPTKEEWDNNTKIIGQNEIANFLNSFMKKSIQEGNGLGLNEEILLFLENSKEYSTQIKNLFYDITKFYFEENNLNRDSLLFNSFNIAKYNDNAGVDDTLAMNYHTDFRQEEVSKEGYNFYVTCLFYLNEDYEGGEISFKILDEKQERIEFSLDYKPNAGDVLVFPSTPPFYHGVKKATGKEKYIVRTYWKNMQPANPNFNEENSGNSFSIKQDGEIHFFQGFKNII